MLAALFRDGSLWGRDEGLSLNRLQSRRETVFVLVLLASLLIMIWSAVLLQTRRDAREAEATASMALNNLNLAFAESTASALQSADLIVRLVRREVQRKGSAFRLEEAPDFTGLIDASFRQIAIIGADGYLADSNLPFARVDLSDRQHFRVHQQAQDDRLFISLPVVGRVSKKPSLQVTRRIDLPNGQFGGVVVLSLASDRLTDFYSSVDLGTQGVITLAGRDGWIRARRSIAGEQVDHNIGQSAAFQAALKAPSGAVWAVSQFDQVERLYAFRHLEKYDLIAFVGRGRDDIMAGVDQLRRMYVGMAALFTLVLLGFSAALVRRVRQQAALVEDLRLSHLKANAANEMKSRFLASVSHELRTPLNGILGFAELMLEPASASEIQEYAQVIHTSGQQLHRLVNTMLDLARIESGRMSASYADTPLAHLLSDACEPHRAAASARQLSLQVSIDPRCPAELHTDRVRLMQVLDNLIHNAVKFTDQGGVTVAAYGNDQVLTIEISDTGRGMSVAQMGRVFARFEAAEQDFCHPGQGAGLGLPLAKELTELVGGVLLIDSTPATGTRATIMLPLRPQSSIDKEDKSS